MTLSTEFLLYVALYRLTVLAIGALSIYLGFRLFHRFPDRHQRGPETASAEVEAGGFKMSMHDFWPGVYFALFGTALVGLMLWQGAPQLTLQDIRETTATGTKTTNTVDVRFDPAVQLGRPQSQTASDEETAVAQELAKLDKLGLTRAGAAEPLSNLARIWQKEGRVGEAVAMARLAYLYGPEIDKTAHLALFADLLEANGEMQKAAEARVELDNLRKQSGGAGE
ncbi:hypothetical protein VU12_02475 [Desulfobulbus sp. US4]|nr:hypothetical protein [Desulfobulbus sp. US4]